MNNQKINNLFKDPRTNWKYIWIIIILGFLAGAGILGYYYLWIAELEAKLTELEFQLPEELIPGIEYFIGGWFSLHASGGDVSELIEIGETFQAGVDIMESAPMQFRIHPLTSKNCPQAREILGTLEYIDRFGECQLKPQASPESLEPVKKEL